MFTRTKDMRSRINFDLDVLSQNNNYIFGQPGTGPNPEYISNPEIRLEKWGGNLRTNAIDLESHLKGIGNPITKSNINPRAPLSHKINYPHYTKDISSHSRISHPVCELRGKFDDPNLRNHRISYFLRIYKTGKN